MNKADMIVRNNSIFLTGNLDYDNVMSVYQKSLNYFVDKDHLCFDFSQIESTNSVGLALIVEWVKFAKKHNKSLQLKNLPKKLLAIAAAADVEDLLQSYQPEFMR